MGLEHSEEDNIMGLGATSRPKRSNSFPEKRMVEDGSFDGRVVASPRLKLDVEHMGGSSKAKKKQSLNLETRDILKKEILELEKRLQGQLVVRLSLEKTLDRGPVSINESSIQKPATELIREIAVLELEIVCLEQHLLSLYRKAFSEQVSYTSPTAKEQREKSSVMTTKRPYEDDAAAFNSTSKNENAAICSGPRSLSNIWTERRGAKVEDKMLDSGVHRCHSSLSQRSTLKTRNSPRDSVSCVVQSFYSQPLSMMEAATPNVISLAEHLGTSISNHIPETPNIISEDMVKCMSAIFYKLSEPPSMHDGLSSPTSSSPSRGGFSPQYPTNVWSPGFGRNSSLDPRLDNPFDVEGLKEFSGPYCTMLEVTCLYRENQKSVDVEGMLQKFGSLIGRLQGVDPKKLKHEEKLAFWINIHNALVMHALLAYGIPRNNVKRYFLLLKAAYNVGGHTVSADMIQSNILGCRMSRPGQWLRILLSPRTKFKTGDERQAYAIEHQEPLLHFALCSGSHSDPALRAYTPKRVSMELESAKEEYIRAAFGVRKDCRIVLPKLVESYVKDAGLCAAGVIEMIRGSLPESLKKSLKRCEVGKSRKSIEWISHNFAFRYLMSKELVRTGSPVPL